MIKGCDLVIVDNGARMLREEVGNEIDRKKVKNLKSPTLHKALLALVDLHRAGYCLCDARVANLLDTGHTGYKWCYMELCFKVDIGAPGSAKLFVKDISMLLNSFGFVLTKGDANLLHQYSLRPSMDYLMDVVESFVDQDRLHFSSLPDRTWTAFPVMVQMV